MKVLFLDFDGPIIPGRAWLLNNHPGGLWEEPCKTSGVLVNEVLHRADAKLVISSTWRKTGGLDGCKDLLYKAGIDLTRLHDDWATIALNSSEGHVRSMEILEWVSRHDVESFIAIDDMELRGLPDENRVKCTTADGVLMDHFVEACNKLGVAPFDGVMLF
tara:strand:- start:9333 stop:9815 length:483 start_codon:yes stop_codon:yes gene_type:complete